ncbi:MAG: phenylacetic acid degradation protein [Chlorobia bacterium]|nr:phenylacetic acid degradation protein [Fimbriimonadaceae bacterium]
MLSVICSLVFAPSAPRELADFLAKKDSSTAWRVVREDRGQTEIELTSQTWQGTVWKHGILIQQPPKVDFKGTGVLYITGDGPRDGDRSQIRLLSAATGMPVAMLFGIPNQPIWDMREDDLIAHTFEKYLATKDPSWPLLFPMTKSAIKAMDAVVDTTKNSSNPLKKFLVTGASKRGWTTWMVGASGDKRVAGIAPMVYDNLNIPVQMKHQIDSWGEYSLQIQDYTRRGLQAKLNTVLGKKLSAIVDPYSYRDQIKVPTLIVNGGNDPYWTADALGKYWGDLKQPKWARIIPNVGHDLGGGILAIEAIGMFGRSLAGAFEMPKWSAKIADYNQYLSVTVFHKSPGFISGMVWVVASDSLDFRESKWLEATRITPSKLSVTVPTVKGKNMAVFVEARFRFKGREFSLTQPARIIPKD